jgi:ribosomal protein L40E
LNSIFDEISFILNIPNRFLECDSLPVGRLTNKLVNKMVYCTKCGTKNDDDAVVCVKCKEPLGSHQTVRRERRRKENECFGLPHGGSIAGLVIGLIIVLWGVTAVLKIPFGDYLWAFVVIIFGTLMVAGALYTMSRRR